MYPYGHGVEGAYLIALARQYGWFHDPDLSVTYTSSGTDSTQAIVFGLDADRLNLIKAQAEADGLTVVRAIRMTDNSVTDY